MVPTHEVEAFRPLVRRHVRRFIRRPQDVEDLTQTILFAAWKSWDRCSFPDNRPAWVRGVARRLLARHWRLEGRAPDTIPLEEIYHLPGGTRTEDAAEERAARELLARLAPSAAPLLWMAAEGLTAREIAEELGISATAVKARLHHARHAIRARLEGQS